MVQKVPHMCEVAHTENDSFAPLSGGSGDSTGNPGSSDEAQLERDLPFFQAYWEVGEMAEIFAKVFYTIVLLSLAGICLTSLLIGPDEYSERLSRYHNQLRYPA
jgi:hypothetical protein